MFNVKFNRNYFDLDVNVIAVTKYTNKENLIKYYENGFFEYGENRIDSFLEKYEYFQKSLIKWHFIGHLQRNKCAKIVNKIDFLHSLESIELAKEINKTSHKRLKCFIEVKISQDENKYGISPNNLFSFYEQIQKFEKIEIIGLMTLGSNTDDYNLIEKEFKMMNQLLNDLNAKFNLCLKDLSMGMSNDYEIAISNKATYVRIGRILIE